MKPALLHAVLGCLVSIVGIAAPAAAQQRAPADPIARAIRTEASRLAVAEASGVQDALGPGAEAFVQLSRRLKPGTSIFVIDRDGNEISGQLRRLSPTSLILWVNGNEREVQSTQISRIEKRDPIWTGGLIGAVIGGVLGLVGGGAGCDCPSGEAEGVAIVGAAGAGIGALADRLVNGRNLVYSGASSLSGPATQPAARTTDAAAVQPDAPPTPPDAVLYRGALNSFGNLSTRIKNGDTVHVINSKEKQTTGKLERISPSSIVLRVDGQLQEIPEAEVRRIVRGRDSLWNGAAIGAGLGALIGGLNCDEVESCAGLVAGTVTLYGAIGIGIDALIGGSQLAYVSPRDAQRDASRVTFAVSGALTDQRKTVRIAIGF